MQVETAIVKSIINEKGNTQTPLYECYGPNADSLYPEVIITKRGYVAGIIPPELRDGESCSND